MEIQAVCLKTMKINDLIKQGTPDFARSEKVPPARRITINEDFTHTAENRIIARILRRLSYDDQITLTALTNENNSKKTAEFLTTKIPDTDSIVNQEVNLLRQETDLSVQITEKQKKEFTEGP
ncbi:Uncharacterised protein [uncultured archaeon]|nr:Uncharacterised protein [uncultured archaeon]